jgi:DNA-binding response OmpR family regulator
MSQVLVVGADTHRARLIDQSLADASVNVLRRGWVAFLRERRTDVPELVIYDLAGPDVPDTEALTQLPATMPETSVLYLGGANAERLERLAAVLERPNVDFVLEPNDPRELRLRAHRLLARRRSVVALTRQDVRMAPIMTQGVLQHTVPALHANNGRLDARAISALFGLPLAALSRALGRSEQSVHKTPAAASLQEPLRLYERIAAALLRLVGSEEGFRIWINAPNPELEGKTPLSVVLNGQAEVVAEMLEDMLMGQPA